jgi:hypothetical protein
MMVQQIQFKKYLYEIYDEYYYNKKYHNDSEYSSLYYTCYIVVKYSINKNNNLLVTIISLLFVLLQIVR